MSLRSFDEGDGGPRAGGPRPLKRPDSRGAEPRPGNRQASPGQRLPEDRGQIEERGGQDGANGTVDRLGRDHRSRRRGKLLGRLSATPITGVRGRGILRSSIFLEDAPLVVAVYYSPVA